MQRANQKLDHSPRPSDKCYTQAAEDGASTSNLSGGTALSDPAADVFGWTNDNNNLSNLMEAGHRRWMLYPPLDQVAYGQVDGYASLKVFGFDSPASAPVPESLAFVALPYRDYPYVLVSQAPRPTPWSISMVPRGTMSSNFDYFGTAQVSVIEKDSGESLSVHSVHRDNKGFGLANFLSWMVDAWQYDTDYLVTISNVRMPGGDSIKVEYPVRVDRYSLFNTSPLREQTDARQENTMAGQFNTPGDEDSYPILLSGDVSVTGQSNFSNWGFFVRVYDSDKNLVKSSDEPFSMKFSFDSYSVIISRCDDDGVCYQGTRNYSVTFN